MVRGSLLPRFKPVTISALLGSLTLIFALQAGNILGHWLAVLLIAVPIVIRVYFNSSLTYLLDAYASRAAQRSLHAGALIGASNFFELAVAVAITLVRSRPQELH